MVRFPLSHEYMIAKGYELKPPTNQLVLISVVRHLIWMAGRAELTTSELFDEEYVRLLLDGSSEEVADGMQRIHDSLSEGMWGYVRKHFPGVQSEDFDIWADTLMALHQMIVAGKFDSERPLLPLLYELVRRKATDKLRRRTTSDAYIEAMSDALSDTVIGDNWSRFSPDERTEVMELIRRAIADLPARQKQVMELFVDNFPESKNMESLRTFVANQSSELVTLASVKRALQEARRKVREYLDVKGYGFAG